MQWINRLSFLGFVVLVALLTVLGVALSWLAMSYLGVVDFHGLDWLVNTLNTLSRYLGYSVLFFVPVLVAYAVFFGLLWSGLKRFERDASAMENLKYYNAGVDLVIRLFFAIGVLFTAWGLQNALVSALGDVSKTEAARLGAWGILKRLVDHGILVALWTTIVGGAGGYLMGVLKFLFLGRDLNRFSGWQQEQEKQVFFEALAAIRSDVARIEQRTNRSIGGASS